MTASTLLDRLLLALAGRLAALGIWSRRVSLAVDRIVARDEAAS